jgi:hypothetical protein
MRAEIKVHIDQLSVEILEWLYDNYGFQSWHWTESVDRDNYATFWFDHDCDAVLFSLRWL